MATNLLTPVSAAAGALSLVSGAAKSLSNLIVASPQTTVGYQPQNPTSTSTGFSLSNLLNLSPKALLFHYEGEQTVMLESDITDHYIEDNTAVQDQIALRPIIITTHGYIGELNDVPPAILAPLQIIAQQLGSINAYAPGLSTTAINAYNTAFQVYQAANSLVNSATSAWASIVGTGESVVGSTGLSSEPNQNLQQTMFQQFFGYWNSRTQFTVQTPWAVFQNMAIYKLRAIQSEETNVITDFEVTFKQIRVASTLSSLPNIVSSVLSSQSASATQLGTQTPAGGPSAAAAVATQ
jgi:hypothetical protein